MHIFPNMLSFPDWDSKNHNNAEYERTTSSVSFVKKLQNDAELVMG